MSLSTKTTLKTSTRMKSDTATIAYYDIAPRVTAFSTTRHGGFSRGVYGGFNINRYCGDDEACIEHNLDLLAGELGVDKANIIMPHQTHGTETRLISRDFLSLGKATQRMILEGVDALLTDVPGVCIGVSTADCIPIILYDLEHHAVAAVHAGWRGTAARIAAKAVAEMGLAYGTRPGALRAVIGPGISLDAFEVGDEVYDHFAAAGFNMETISRREAKWHIDLKECNRLQLTALGVAPGNISVSAVCTYTDYNDYFSARRLGAQSGRIFTGAVVL